MRPVAEMQFADFISCAWDHLVTVAAKQHYRTGAALPFVVRCPSGGGFSGGPFHSQNPESSLRAHPGPEDRLPVHAGGRQGPAARGDPRPEPGALLRAQAPLPPHQGRGARRPSTRRVRPGARAPRGQRRHDRDVGRDGAHGRRRRRRGGARTASSVEVLDLRTIIPWDREAVLESVRAPASCWCCTRTPARRFRRRDRGHGRRGELRAPRRAGPAAGRARHARAVLAAAREGVHPAGRRRRAGDRAPRGVLSKRRKERSTWQSEASSTWSCPRWASASRKARSAAGRSRSATGSRPTRRSSRSRPTRSIPRCRRPRSGTVVELLVPEGETVPVTTVIARIDTAGGARSLPSSRSRRRRSGAAAPRRPAPPSRRRPPRRRARRAEPAPERSAGRARAAAALRCPPPPPAATRAARPRPRPARRPPPGAGRRRRRNGDMRTFMSPVVARMVAEHGLDIGQIPGTGRGGRVTKHDVEGFLAGGAAARRRRPRPQRRRPPRAARHRRRSAPPPGRAAARPLRPRPLRRRRGRAAGLPRRRLAERRRRDLQVLHDPQGHRAST